jgi:serine/threonine-protein kinase
MSEVYLSYDVPGRRPVAVKLLADHLADRREAVARFHREARFSQHLGHPNLVRGFATGYDPSARKHYLVLEYIDGPSAQTALTHLRRLPVGVAVRAGIDVARALAFLHGRQFVHRDVKPDNILFHPGGGAKLADMGLVKRLDDGSQLTAFRQGVGTSHYMPFEQALNPSMVDGRSDVFALGATLYHFLTGELPFAGDTHEAITRGKQDGTFVPARGVNPAVPPDLDRIVSAALARDPRARFQTAGEFADALAATGLSTPIPPTLLTDPGAAAETPETPTRADLPVADAAETVAAAALVPAPPVTAAARVRTAAAVVTGLAVLIGVADFTRQVAGRLLYGISAEDEPADSGAGHGARSSRRCTAPDRSNRVKAVSPPSNLSPAVRQ